MPQQFTVRPIQASTKGQVKQLRREGSVPVSIQHRGNKTLHLQTETKPLDDFIRAHGEAAMLELIVEGGVRHQALISEIQRDRVTKKLLQVTFQGVQLGDSVKVHIPLVFHGEPEPVRLQTALLQHSIEQLEIRCQPGDLPDHITVDVSNMMGTDTLRVSDLPPQDKYEILTSADTVIASLTVHHVEDEAPAPTSVEGPHASTDGPQASPALPNESTEPAAS